MNRVVRAVLVWVIVLAMPVQGMAASLMLFCGPSHARMVQGLRADAAAVPAAQADGVAHHRHAHAHDPAPTGQATPQPAAPDAHHGHLAQAADGSVSCSACAACCAAMALPARLWVPEAVQVDHPVHTPLAAPVESQPPDGPDRPPRARLA